jgi:hypothetical protein
MKPFTILLLIVAARSLAGCTPVAEVPPDAPIDAAPAPLDAPDARPTAVRDRIELLPASGSATGAGYTLDFQLGPRNAHAASSGGGFQLQTSAPVVP